MNIVLIGAGNLATHLGTRLVEAGETVVQVYSRDISNAAELAKVLNARPFDNFHGLSAKADLYIIAVADNAIAEVVKKLGQMPFEDKLVVHTSGATPSKVFGVAPNLERTGVFYPLQTFTKGKPVSFSEVPICIDAAQPDDLQALESLGGKISDHVYKINDAQRAWLHVAAVFVNNFTNHLFEIGHSILKKQNLPFEMLLPLIHETVSKLDSGPPKAMRTA
ncbi:MAG: DUF2520 domain-containing protein [Saprospiraceae bacterium]|nr:DUF2520 domain-containing protein [Saprospiraceae bacterium]